MPSGSSKRSKLLAHLPRSAGPRNADPCGSDGADDEIGRGHEDMADGIPPLRLHNKGIDQGRTGDLAAKHSVTIQLMDETGKNAVMTWRLTNARPLKYTGPSLNAKTSLRGGPFSQLRGRNGRMPRVPSVRVQARRRDLTAPW